MSERKPEEVHTEQELGDREVLQEKPEEEEKRGGQREEEGQKIQQGETITEESSVEARLQREIDDLRASLEEARREAAENYEKFLRTLADLDNFRRRTRMEYEEVVANANRELMAGLLPIIDNFERALAAAEQTQNFEALHEGVVLIWKQLRELLSKFGVEPIEAKGKPFDPSLHEAILQAEPSEEFPPGTVVEEIQKGYRMKGRLLRPSLVKVARTTEE